MLKLVCLACESLIKVQLFALHRPVTDTLPDNWLRKRNVFCDVNIPQHDFDLCQSSFTTTSNQSTLSISPFNVVGEVTVIDVFAETEPSSVGYSASGWWSDVLHTSAHLLQEHWDNSFNTVFVRRKLRRTWKYSVNGADEVRCSIQHIPKRRAHNQSPTASRWNEERLACLGNRRASAALHPYYWTIYCKYHFVWKASELSLCSPNHMFTGRHLWRARRIWPPEPHCHIPRSATSLI